MRLIFDGHLDIALWALANNQDQTEPVELINAQRQVIQTVEYGRADTDEVIEIGG